MTTKVKHKPGNAFLFTSCISTGSHKNYHGNGGISISLHTPHMYCQYIDLGDIYFADQTPEQYDALVSADFVTNAGSAGTDAMRRLSKKQAAYLQMKITAFIMDEFKGSFPSDADITPDMLNKKE